MEKHRCKLCYRKFSNGRALGGHMRSHMMNMPVDVHPPRFSSSESEAEEGEIVTLHDDRGSDTESSKNVTRRRSKRPRKPVSSLLMRNLQDYKFNCDDDDDDDDDFDKYYNNDVEQQTGSSSISEVTSEEDVAFCLMMMSRDRWHGDEIVASPVVVSSSSYKKRYKCETCNKMFKSYQALGGHRASHKKNRVVSVTYNNEKQQGNVAREEEEEEKQKVVHECPVCLRVFASGQALGGHKRSHVVVVVGNNNNNGEINPADVQLEVTTNKKREIISESMIDLNLPAPVDVDVDDADDYDR